MLQIQERSAGKDTQNMEGETHGLDEGRNQNLQNSVLGFLDAQGTEGSNNNTSKGGLQSMADAGTFSLNKEDSKKIGFVTGFVGLGISNFDKGGNYLHYLPKSNKLKVYNRPYVNQHTVNTKISTRGTSVLFGINEFSISNDYFRGTIDFQEFKGQTYMNVLGSISPQFGLLFFTYGAMEELNNVSNEIVRQPEVQGFFKELFNEVDKLLDPNSYY